MKITTIRQNLSGFIKTIMVATALTMSVGMQAAVLKIATAAPNGSDWMNRMNAGAAEVKKRTDGRVKIKFYAGGVMGSDSAVLRKMRIGQLHGGAFTSGALESIYKDIGAYSLPFLFRDEAEVAYVREQMDKELIAGLKAKRMVSFGFASGGFGMLMSPEAMPDFDSIKGKKLWVPENDDLSFHILKELGLSPVKLPLTDVLTGIQTQLLDVVGSSPTAAIALQWHTKVKHVYDQPLMYLYATMVIDQRFFGKLSKQDQQIVTEVFTDVYKQLDKIADADNKKAEEALKSTGIAFNSGDPAMMEEIVAKVNVINADLIKDGKYSKDMYDKIQKHLAVYRAK